MDKIAFAYDVPQTRMSDDGSHHIAWTPSPAQAIVDQVAEAIARDRDGKIRQALIDLGWTPPPE